MGKIRLDALLVKNGQVQSRERAKALIMAGQVYVKNQKCDKAGQMVDEDTEFLNVYYGKEIKKPQADVMLKALETKYADDEIEVSFQKGGQPLYYYIISAE